MKEVILHTSERQFREEIHVQKIKECICDALCGQVPKEL